MIEKKSGVESGEHPVMCCKLCGRPVYPWNWCKSCDGNLINFVRRRYRWWVLLAGMVAGMLVLAVVNFSFGIPTFASALLGAVIGFSSAGISRRKTAEFCFRELDDIDVIDRVECGEQLRMQGELISRMEYHHSRRN